MSCPPRLHVITDTTLQSRYSHAEIAALAIAGGADAIQYRSKTDDIRRMIADAESVAQVCRRLAILFIVNDRVDIALAVDADGVHLGLEDMPIDVARGILGADKIIGGTVRDRAGLDKAARLGADYVGLGPVFDTSTKNVDYPAIGIEGVARVAAGSPIPIIAIAGISHRNVRSVIDAGAWGVAVIGAVCAADNPLAATKILRSAIYL